MSGRRSREGLGPDGIYVLTTAEHKYNSVVEAVKTLGWSTRVEQIEPPEGIVEPELVDPDAMIRGKMNAQLANVVVRRQILDLQTQCGTLRRQKVMNADVLAVVGETVLKKPDEGHTALDALVNDVRTYLIPQLSGGSQALIEKNNVNAGLRLQDAAKPEHELEMGTAYQTLQMQLSGPLVRLLSDPTAVKNLIRDGVLENRLLSTTSISGLKFEQLLAYGLPALCQAKANDGYAMEIEGLSADGTRSRLKIDKPDDPIREAHALHTLFARGVHPLNIRALFGDKSAAS